MSVSIAIDHVVKKFGENAVSYTHLAGRLGADLLLATDPDCDRVGVAVRDRSGGYVLLSGLSLIHI